MGIPGPSDDPFVSLWGDLEKLKLALGRNAAVNVNSRAIRDAARSLSQAWFRVARPAALGVGLPEDQLRGFDSSFQYLLKLSAGRNARRSYGQTIRSLGEGRASFEASVERGRGIAGLPAASSVRSLVEQRILATLKQMLPGSALSYEQALDDLAAPVRLSYRGTATELREVVREVLDHLAPDRDVVASTGFKLEKGRAGPTMKQKARFILKARRVGETTRKAPEDAVELLEDHIASLARSTYERGSVATHGATTLREAQRFKGYADAVLAELLQVH